MKDINNQVYNAIEARLQRICKAEFAAAHKSVNGRLRKPLTYSQEVFTLVELLSQVVDASASECESIMATITGGAIQDKFLKA